MNLQIDDYLERFRSFRSPLPHGRGSEPSRARQQAVVFTNGENALSRPRRYNRIDGAWELGIGSSLLGIGLFGWAQMTSSPGSVWRLFSIQYKRDRKKGLVNCAASIVGSYELVLALFHASRGSGSRAAAAILGLGVAALPPALIERLVGSAPPSYPLPVDAFARRLLLCVLNGAVILVSGGITFWLYLRGSRPQVQDAE